MKVLHLLSTSWFSGAEKVARDIVINLSKDITPVFVCTGEQLAKEVRKYGIKTYVIRPFDGISMLFKSKELEYIILNEGIDIIHAHNLKASIKGYVSSRTQKTLVISHIHNTYEWMKRITLKRILDSIFRKRYALSISCSRIAKKHYIQYNKRVKKENIVVLPNAIDFSEIPKNLKVLDNSKKTKLLFIGRLEKAKRIDLMIGVIEKTVKVHKDIILNIIGDGALRKELESLTKSKGLENHIKFLGYKNNVYDYLNTADIFLLTSDYEGLPMVLLEAMAMKKIVITTNVGGISELIKDGKTGFLIDKGDPTRFSERLIGVIDNLRAIKKKIGKETYGLVKKDYNLKGYMESLEKLYWKVYKTKKKNEQNQ